jgi:2-dehydro-3-deoxygalactonokinase
MPPALIAIDWGTSSFRAFLTARDGAILDRIETADGVATMPPGGFPAAFARLAGPWLAGRAGLPVLASGMVGSRNGWREAPYVPCPADPAAIAAKLVTVFAGEATVHIAPGLSFEDATGRPDVMRGEEVEILGLAEAGAGLVVLPGSHSKWARVESGCVTSFRTFVTGEVFAAIRDHTLVGAFARNPSSGAPGPIGPAFALGACRGAEASRGENGAGLIGALFGARTLPLMGKLPETDAADWLSGLLIGAEIAEARRLFSGGAPLLAGAPTLVERYRAAFAALGDSALAAPPGAAARGLFRLALDAGLIA